MEISCLPHPQPRKFRPSKGWGQPAACISTQEYQEHLASQPRLEWKEVPQATPLPMSEELYELNLESLSHILAMRFSKPRPVVKNTGAHAGLVRRCGNIAVFSW